MSLLDELERIRQAIVLDCGRRLYDNDAAIISQAIEVIENIPKWLTLMEFLKPCPLTFDLVAWVELPSGRVIHATLARSSSCELTIRSLPDGIEIQPYDVVRIAKVPEVPK